MQYKKFLVDVLKEASAIASNYFGKVSGTIKPDDPNQVLTKADIEVGKYLISQIEKEFPSHNIIDEEAGVIDKKSAFTWVTDPIDGTSNFAAGTPLYGVMIGLLEDDKVIAGGVALPAFSEIYVAEKSGGAYCNGKKIAVTKETSLKSVLVVYGIDSNQNNPDDTRQEAKLFGEIALACRNMRISNSCFDTMMLARGSYGGWLNKSSKIWDNVAQQIIIEEAGGVYTDLYGKPIDYTLPLSKAKLNFTQCIASPILHEQLQKIILALRV
ncbi:MAG: hypothetical protein ACD_57C00078G0002 [uncultured bacterium]|nr:MAG: hypothetical protein ACD_57C00078G0002 [uncultured bacterium]